MIPIPVCARRAQFPRRRRPQPVRAVRQCVSGHGPALEPDRCRPRDDRQRIARDRPPDPDRRRDRCDARQARRHRPDDGGDGGCRDHHLRRSDVLADGVRLERAGGRGGRLCSGGLGADPRPCHERAARAPARPQLGFRPWRQHRRSPSLPAAVGYAFSQRAVFLMVPIFAVLTSRGGARHSRERDRSRSGARPDDRRRSAGRGRRISRSLRRRARS